MKYTSVNIMNQRFVKVKCLADSQHFPAACRSQQNVSNYPEIVCLYSVINHQVSWTSSII